MDRQFLFTILIVGLLSGLLSACDTTAVNTDARGNTQARETALPHYPYYDGEYTHDDENDGD